MSKSSMVFHVSNFMRNLFGDKTYRKQPGQLKASRSVEEQHNRIEKAKAKRERIKQRNLRILEKQNATQ